MIRLLLLPLLTLCFCTRVRAQTELTPEAFLDLVAEHHPLSWRARLRKDRADAELMMARGGFDPKAFADISQKYFKGTTYYQLLEGGVKVPTWYGVELKATYEDNSGVYRNPQELTPDAGLYAAGLSVNLGRGLFIDERRAQLRQARIAQELSVAEQEVLLNELLYEAGQAYWEWYLANRGLEVYETAVELARQRLDLVTEGARLGDRPAIDTLEATIQLTNRELALAEARLDVTNGAALLGVYLWLEGRVPLELEPGTVPVSSVVLPEPVTVPTLHPVLRATELKLDQLEIDRRLARENLKPVLRLDYNFLSATTGDELTAQVSNYKWGLTASSSLLLRKERAKLRLTEIKLSEEQLGLSDKRATLGFKLAAATNTLDILTAQLPLVARNADDTERLLEGERRLFGLGESSLFLVNSREQKFIETQLKVAALEAKLGKAALGVRYAAGTLGRVR